MTNEDNATIADGSIALEDPGQYDCINCQAKECTCDMSRCKQCDRVIAQVSGDPPSEICSRECMNRWDAEHPGYWTRAEGLTTEQRAEFDAVFGERERRH